MTLRCGVAAIKLLPLPTAAGVDVVTPGGMVKEAESHKVSLLGTPTLRFAPRRRKVGLGTGLRWRNVGLGPGLRWRNLERVVKFQLVDSSR